MPNMYESDMVRDVGVAGASAAGLADATRGAARAQGLQFNREAAMVDTANTIFKGAVQGDIEHGKRQAQKLQEEALTSNMAANEARSLINKAEAQRTQILNELSTAEDVGDISFGKDARVEAAGQRIGELKEQVDRLKAAAQGGMSFDEYAMRVSALAKQYVARYPGYADDVRKVIGAASGMEGADLWAQQQFVKQWADKKTGTEGALSAQKLFAETLGRMEGKGFGTQLELLQLSQQDPAKFQRLTREFTELNAISAKNEGVKKYIDTQRDVSDYRADEMLPAFIMFQNTRFAGKAFTDIINSKSTLGAHLQGLADGSIPLDNAERVDAAVKIHVANVEQHIATTEREAIQELQVFKAKNPHMSKAAYDEAEARIKAQSQLYRNEYASEKGMIAASNAIKNYRDKGIAEMQKAMDLNIKLMNVMPTEMVKAFMRGGKDRERLLADGYKDFYDLMSRVEKETMGAFGASQSGLDMGAAAKIPILQTNFQSAGTTGNPTPRLPGVDQQTQKASIELVSAEALHRLNASRAMDAMQSKVVSSTASKGQLSPFDFNLLKTFISDTIGQGASAKLAKATYESTAASVAALVPDQQATVKWHTSEQSKIAVADVLKRKAAIEKEFGVTLRVGVNDAGEIALTAPPPPPKYDTQNDQYIRDTQKIRDAQRKFWNQNAAVLSNLVYVRAGATGEEPKKIANEYALLFDTNKPFNGFFNVYANVPEKEGTAPTSSGDNLLSNSIRSLK